MIEGISVVPLDVRSSVRIAHASSHPQVDLRRIHSVVWAEADLLHPPIDSMEQSYRSGKAIALLNGRENEAVGYARFSPLLDQGLQRKLGLEGLPEVWELGTAVVDPEHRGQGLYSPMSNALLETVQEDIAEKRLLVLGTTKTTPFLRSLAKAEPLGINFTSGSHDEFPMVEPLTCVCTGSFGQGMQLTPDCPQRVQGPQLIQLDDIAFASPNKIAIPCVMFLSDKALAGEVDRALFEKFSYGEKSPQANFIHALTQIGYFE